MAIAQVKRQFPAEVASAGAARHFVDETLRVWGLDEIVDPVRLMVDELVTNAVLHASSAAEVRLVLDDDCLHVEVEDGSDQPPIAVEPSDRGGRGLVIVEALSSQWGYALTATGKRVWFDLPVDDVDR